jgi:hypothetical protein
MKHTKKLGMHSVFFTCFLNFLPVAFVCDLYLVKLLQSLRRKTNTTTVLPALTERFTLFILLLRGLDEQFNEAR